MIVDTTGSIGSAQEGEGSIRFFEETRIGRIGVGRGRIAGDGGGEDLVFADELKDWIGLDPVSEVLVFFWFDAAGGVDEGSSRVEVGDDGREDVELEFGEAGYLRCHGAVAGFHAAGKDPGVGAGDIGEDEVGSVGDGFFELIHMTDEDILVFGVAIKDIHEGVEASGVDLHRDDGGVREPLSELARLGALSGAIIDDCAVVAIWDGVDDIAACWVLNAEGWIRIEEAGEVGARSGVDTVGGGIVGIEVVGVGDLGPVVAIDQRWGIHEGVGNEPMMLVWVELRPAFDGCFGDGVGGGGVGEGVCGECRVVEFKGGAAREGDCVGLIVVGIEKLTSGPCDLAEDGVGHATGFGADVPLGPFDGFVYDGVGREAVEEEELGRGTDEDSLHARFDRLESSASKLGDDMAEGDPAGDRFADDCVAEGTIAWFEVLDLGLNWEEIGEGYRVGTQDAVGSVAGICGWGSGV